MNNRWLFAGTQHLRVIRNVCLQDSGVYEYCELCDVNFSSVRQAEQHYNGKNHGKKMRMSEANACLDEAAEANLVLK